MTEKQRSRQIKEILRSKWNKMNMGIRMGGTRKIKKKREKKT